MLIAQIIYPDTLCMTPIKGSLTYLNLFSHFKSPEAGFGSRLISEFYLIVRYVAISFKGIGLHIVNSRELFRNTPIIFETGAVGRKCGCCGHRSWRTRWSDTRSVPGSFMTHLLA